jgi:microcystin-dependent protein
MRIDGRNKRVGINQVSPAVALDVTGSGHFTESLQLASTDSATSTTTGALIVSGGTGIAENLYVGGNANFQGHIQVGEQGSGTVAIQPTDDGTQSFSNQLDIGTTNNKFRNVYSETFTGRLVGSVVGDVFGNVNGTADRLVASTVFKMAGHVADSTGFSFDGQTGGAEKTFNVTLTQDAISDQAEVTDNENDDELLIVREGQGLRRVQRSNFFAGASLVPIGAIMPYAGPIASFADIPSGYLLCDGSEVQQGIYPDLFDVIQFTYGAGVNPSTFKLPDLRGRFPLGLDNMDNGTTVNDVSGVAVDAGGGVANRVTNTSARSLGGSGGTEIIDTTNVAFGSGSQFDTTSGSGPYQNQNVMNPYLAIHYIIRSGEPAA